MVPHWHNILVAINDNDFELLLEMAADEGYTQEGVSPKEMKQQLIHMGTTNHKLFYRVLRTYCALCLKSTIEKMK
jgi:hypothetical protein